MIVFHKNISLRKGTTAWRWRSAFWWQSLTYQEVASISGLLGCTYYGTPLMIDEGFFKYNTSLYCGGTVQI